MLAVRGAGGCPRLQAPWNEAGKRSSAVLRLLARAKAIPGEARLAPNRFPTRYIRNYYLDGVLDRVTKSLWVPTMRGMAGINSHT